MKLKLFQITFLSVVLALCGCAAERQAAGTAVHVVEQCPMEEGFPKHTMKAIPLTMPKDIKQRVLTEEDLAKIKDFSPMTYAEHLNEKKTFVGYSDIFLLDDYIFLGFSNVEYSIIDKRTWKMRRFEYKQDENDYYIGLARIISYDPTNKTLIGINNSPFCEDDNLYIYTLQP